LDCQFPLSHRFSDSMPSSQPLPPSHPLLLSFHSPQFLPFVPLPPSYLLLPLSALPFPTHSASDLRECARFFGNQKAAASAWSLPCLIFSIGYTRGFPATCCFQEPRPAPYHSIGFVECPKLTQAKRNDVQIMPERIRPVLCTLMVALPLWSSTASAPRPQCPFSRGSAAPRVPQPPIALWRRNSRPPHPGACCTITPC